MESFEKMIFKIATEVYKSGKEEFKKIRKFLSDEEINDYELECIIALFEDFKDIFVYDDPLMSCYFDEDRRKRLRRYMEFEKGFEEFYDSFLTRTRSELDIGIRHVIPKIDFAFYRIKSYFQILVENLDVKSLEELDNLLLDIEIKALLLRDKIAGSIMREILIDKSNGFLNYNLYLECSLIMKDGETDITFPALDLKFLNPCDLRFLRCNEKVKDIRYKLKKITGCYTCRKLQRAIETCGWKEFKVSDLGSILVSVVLEKDYIIT